MMLTLTQGTIAVQAARKAIEEYVKHHTSTSPSLEKVFLQKQGVFVTLHTHPEHDLRGCIGIPYPVMTLQDALIEAAQSVTRDPRFPPLATQETGHVIVEITVLTPPEQLQVKQPQEYLKKIKVGHDGLIVEQGYYKGLLLPQVPIEQGWDVEEFLSNTCMKAGLPPDAWFDSHTKVFTFAGQIFSETAPRGTIEEKRLNGSHC